MTLLTKKEISRYLSIVDKVPENERNKIFALMEMDRVERCRESFLFFAQQMWPIFISGRHHKIMADAFERVASGELKRLIINMPPRHTKSEFASFLLPSWFLGKFPEKKIIQTAHTAELAVGFGRKVRNLVSSEQYSKVFDTKLSSDSKAGGDYFAIGVGGAVTGKGADLLIIDDPHSEQEAKQNNPAIFDGVYEWYTSGPRQRLQPGGAIIIVMTRWSKRDLTGQILKASEKDGVNEWEIIEFPAILPSGTPLWPGFWGKAELEALKAELPVAKWEAQYQQNPTSIKKRMEFPELKKMAMDMWLEWKPDTLIVEKKAAGAPLIYEMRKMGIPLSEYTPGKGHDKIARVNSISDLFASGFVWCPDTRFADEVMEEMASFPNGDHDDLVDSSSQALIRFRQGGFITIDSDEEDYDLPRRKVEYY